MAPSDPPREFFVYERRTRQVWLASITDFPLTRALGAAPKRYGDEPNQYGRRYELVMNKAVLKSQMQKLGQTRCQDFGFPRICRLLYARLACLHYIIRVGPDHI